MNNTIYYLSVDIKNDDGETDHCAIGFYSAPELVIDGARGWVEKEFDFDEDIYYDYCFVVFRGNINERNITRIDLSKDQQDILLTKNLRAIEKEYMKQ